MRILTSFRCPTGTFMPAISKGFMGTIPNPKSQIPMKSQIPNPNSDSLRQRIRWELGFGSRDFSLPPPRRPRGRLDEHLRDVLPGRLLEALEARRGVDLDDHRPFRRFEDVHPGQVQARRVRR